MPIDWIENIKLDENKSLSELYYLYRSDITSWLIKNHSVTEDASKEIFQISVIQLYENVISGKLKVLTCDIKTYLIGICRLKSFEYKRNNKFSALNEALDYNHDFIDPSNISEKTKLEEELQLMNKSLDILGEPCKSIITLFYHKEMSMSEITNTLSYKNTSTTKNLKYKCLKRLQSLYK